MKPWLKAKFKSAVFEEERATGRKPNIVVMGRADYYAFLGHLDLEKGAQIVTTGKAPQDQFRYEGVLCLLCYSVETGMYFSRMEKE